MRLAGHAPPGITDAIRGMAGPDTRVFNPQPWGSWFEYAIPEVAVAIDSRIELFEPSTWDAYEGVANGVDGWEAQLATWEVDVGGGHRGRRARSPTGCARRAGRRYAYEDADGLVFVRP